jgi:hypothetical protein
MRRLSTKTWTTLAAAALMATLANAGQTWTFDVTTTGQDVTWTSPTAVDPAASVYAVKYTITKVEVDVTWLGIPFNNIDVTNEVPPELQSAAFDVPGPAPIAALNTPVVIPPPPEAPAFAADLSFGLNAGGQGFASATGVTLGTLQVNLGGFFGVQTVTLTSVRLVGQLTIHAAWYDLGQGLAGTTGVPTLTGSGSLVGGQPMSIALAGAKPSSSTLFIIGLSTINLPFAGGIMVPSIDVLLTIPTDPLGGYVIPAVWPNGIPANTSIHFQSWVLNAGGTGIDGASNALRAVAQ